MEFAKPRCAYLTELFLGPFPCSLVRVQEGVFGDVRHRSMSVPERLLLRLGQSPAASFVCERPTPEERPRCLDFSFPQFNRFRQNNPSLKSHIQTASPVSGAAALTCRDARRSNCVLVTETK